MYKNNKMHFGMPTLIELNTIEECAALCSKLGLNFIELNMCFPQYQNLNVSLLKEMSQKYGIYYTIHLDENLSPCDFNDRVSNAYIETTLYAISVAKQLNIPILNMHLQEGVLVTLPYKRVHLFDAYEDVYLQKLMNFRNKCEEAIGSADIKICIENTNGYHHSFLKKSLDLLQKSPIFALTLDIGHSAVTGFVDEIVIAEYENSLTHMHVHDATSTSNHLPLGEGELDLSKYVNLAVKHNCRGVIETKTVDALYKCIEWLKTETGF